uniref:Uncharacterized protein n=1 Tax=viral metagenome TaxID=1070528 RepID=A0A6C0KG98_9ZZZZ
MILLESNELAVAGEPGAMFCSMSGLELSGVKFTELDAVTRSRGIVLLISGSESFDVYVI